MVDGMLDDDGKLSVGFGTTTDSGLKKEITGEVRPVGFVMATVDGVLSTEMLIFCGVLLTELLPRLSTSPTMTR